MRKISSLLLLLALGLRFQAAFGQVTNSPYVEERYTRSVRIVRVELTDQYTIIHMQYGNPALSQKFMMPLLGQDGWISFDPDSRLYKPGVTSQRFMFVKAEGIPVSPKQMSVSSDELVDFKVYFERLDPGIEVFDLFEGPNPDEKTNFWNFYGIHIKNPLTKKPQPRPAAPQPAEKAKPEPKPKVPEPVIAERPAENNQPDKITESTESDAGADENKEVEGSLKSKPLAKGATVKLEKIYFATSKYELLPESYEQLDELVAIMRENPSLKIRIEGHTDNLGDFDKNVELSRQRAEAVRDYLTKKGIATERIETQGYGPTRPVGKGNSESERSKNRRVEFVITEI